MGRGRLLKDELVGTVIEHFNFAKNECFAHDMEAQRPDCVAAVLHTGRKILSVHPAHYSRHLLVCD
jgi:hypothetical protein